MLRLRALWPAITTGRHYVAGRGLESLVELAKQLGIRKEMEALFVAQHLQRDADAKMELERREAKMELELAKRDADAKMELQRRDTASTARLQYVKNSSVRSRNGTIWKNSTMKPGHTFLTRRLKQ